MDTLDSDDYELVDGNGVRMKRDIAQFVRLNEFREGAKTNVDQLAEAVLGEVPEQLVDYMTYIKHMPGDPIKSDELQSAFERPTESHILEEDTTKFV